MTEDWAATVAESATLLSGGASAAVRLQAVMQLLHDRHRRYEWVGLYLLRGGELHLGPYVGAPTEHTRIPVGRGVCGTAIAEGRNQLVAEVRERANYLACSATVRSEIVVLIRAGDRLLGQIDADCDTVGAFTAEDEAGLEALAVLLAPVVAELERES